MSLCANWKIKEDLETLWKKYALKVALASVCVGITIRMEIYVQFSNYEKWIEELKNSLNFSLTKN